MFSALNGILEFEESLTNCVILNKQFVLAPGKILETHIKSSTSIKDFLNDVLRRRPIKLPKDKKFLVKYLKNKGTKTYSQLAEAEPLTTFFCKEIYDSILAFGHPNTETLNNISQHLKCYFVVLKIISDNPIEVNFEKLFSSLLKKVGTYQKLKVLDDVCTVSAPFNSELFQNSIHLSKIANIRDDSLLILSNLLPRDCEGCPVFNRKLKLVGIVIYTTIEREKLDLTVAVNFSTIVSSLLNVEQVRTFDDSEQFLSQIIGKSLVKVFGKNSIGSGVLISVQSQPFVLTCSHILDGYKKGDSVDCQYLKGNFPARLLWRNECYEKPYDLAILKPKNKILMSYCAHIAQKCHSTQPVIAAGIPFYSLSSEFNPSYFAGYILKSNKSIIQHDAVVHYGQSGGPLYDEKGEVIGICVSNLKYNSKIYPKMCFAINLLDVKSYLEKFNESNDITDLEKLGNLSPDILSIWSLQVKHKL